MRVILLSSSLLTGCIDIPIERISYQPNDCQSIGHISGYGELNETYDAEKDLFWRAKQADATHVFYQQDDIFTTRLHGETVTQIKAKAFKCQSLTKR